MSARYYISQNEIDSGTVIRMVKEIKDSYGYLKKAQAVDTWNARRRILEDQISAFDHACGICDKGHSIHKYRTALRKIKTSYIDTGFKFGF